LPYIPGSPIEAYCGKCKSDRNHIVLEADGMQVRLVRCEKCGEEGSLVAPRAKTRAALLEIAQKKKKKKKAPATKRRSKKAVSPEEMFRELTDGSDLSSAVPYNVKKPLSAGDIVDHPTFGIGIVTVKTDVQKAKIFFETGERIMICNRK
jgi:hypothetical protein